MTNTDKGTSNKLSHMHACACRSRTPAHMPQKAPEHGWTNQGLSCLRADNIMLLPFILMQMVGKTCILLAKSGTPNRWKAGQSLRTSDFDPQQSRKKGPAKKQRPGSLTDRLFLGANPQNDPQSHGRKGHHPSVTPPLSDPENPQDATWDSVVAWESGSVLTSLASTCPRTQRYRRRQQLQRGTRNTWSGGTMSVPIMKIFFFFPASSL